MLKKGTKVVWNWGAHEAMGKITKIFRKPVSKKIKGTTVKRKASADEPAYEIQQDDGSKVLKSKSELKRAS